MNNLQIDTELIGGLGEEPDKGTDKGRHAGVRRGLGKGLGQGLSALLANDLLKVDGETGFIPNLPLESISPNPKQPRFSVNPEELIGLADSIREHGVIEPLIVTKDPHVADRYQLVAGERRWRAAKLAKLAHVPVVIKDISPQQILELAIIENIQRQDLNALEEATAIAELHNTYHLKLEDIAKKIGKDISTLSNKMRLLKLPQVVQVGILSRQITESHAYQILALKSTDAILAAFNIIVKKELSVKQTQELVRRILHANKEVFGQNTKQNAVLYDDLTIKITQDLVDKLGKGVKVHRRKNGGSLTLPFNSDEHLQSIYQYLMST